MYSTHSYSTHCFAHFCKSYPLSYISIDDIYTPEKKVPWLSHPHDMAFAASIFFHGVLLEGAQNNCMLVSWRWNTKPSNKSMMTGARGGRSLSCQDVAAASHHIEALAALAANKFFYGVLADCLPVRWS